MQRFQYFTENDLFVSFYKPFNVCFIDIFNYHCLCVALFNWLSVSASNWFSFVWIARGVTVKNRTVYDPRLFCVSVSANALGKGMESSLLMWGWQFFYIYIYICIYLFVLKIRSNFRIKFYSWINELKRCFTESKYSSRICTHFSHRLTILFISVQWMLKGFGATKSLNAISCFSLERNLFPHKTILF